MEESQKNSYLPWLVIACAVAAMVAILALQGRVWWCKWDTPIYIWNSGVWSKHNSQHFFDPYLFTHLLHGVALYWIGKLIFRDKLGFLWLLAFAVVAECIWELVENSKWVLDRYRDTTASLDYFGDSIANSFGDIVSCAVGFYVAHKLKLWLSLAFFILVELVLILAMRDSLLMNILMLLYPIDSIREWQRPIASLFFLG